MIWCFNKPCRSRWNPFTFETETISCGKWLYTHINPSALRLSTSRNDRLRMSSSCLSCSLLPALVFRRCAVERLNTSLKWFGPLSNVQRWISPSIAISRLHVNGARLKWNSACFADIPSSAKNLFGICQAVPKCCRKHGRWLVCGIPHTIAIGFCIGLPALHQ